MGNLNLDDQQAPAAPEKKGVGLRIVRPGDKKAKEATTAENDANHTGERRYHSTFQGTRRGRGRGTYLQQQQQQQQRAQNKETFSSESMPKDGEEFDFEASNEKFDKDEVEKEFNEKNQRSVTAAYNKETSFFDSLSRDTSSPSRGRGYRGGRGGSSYYRGGGRGSSGYHRGRGGYRGSNWRSRDDRQPRYQEKSSNETEN